MPETGLTGFISVKDKLSLFNDVNCQIVVGRGCILSDIIKVAPDLIGEATVYSDEAFPKPNGILLNVAKGQKFPIDFAAVFDENGYLIVKGKSVFGAISEVEGHALTKRIIANILRNYK